MLYEKCKNFRIKNNIKLKDISKISGFSISYICKFEHGKSRNIDIVQAYVKLGLPDRDLFDSGE